MHLDPPDHTDAVRRYYAAFPALKKGEESPQQYYLPPPAWCRKSAHEKPQVKMQSGLSLSKEYNNYKSKKIPTGKERRNSYNGQRKSSKKRGHNYSRSLESKENLPEWVTHEGVWDMETQDPIKEFIKAIALDEGYGTCENTVTDEVREIAQVRMDETKVPDWDDGLDLESAWVITDDLAPRQRSPLEEEIYAKFEAKFNRSIEALWSNEPANTPDDEYQELPIDFQDLLASPSDSRFAEPTAEKCSMISLTESIWSNDAHDSLLGLNQSETPTRSVEVLHDRFKPLNLTDDVFKAEPRPKTPIQVVQETEPFSLYSYEGIYEAVPTVSDVMLSLTAINHSKDFSSFAEVIPRRPSERAKPAVVEKVECPLEDDEDEHEDLLVSNKTHFRPIRKEKTVEVAAIGYADGDTFDIRGELAAVHFHRSESGFMYLQTEVESPKRYLEYRTRSIDYDRLNLTEAQRVGNDMSNLAGRDFKLKFPVRMMEKGVQTDDDVEGDEGDARAAWACDECGRRGGAKKMRQSGIDSIWSDADYCGHCSVGIEQATLPAQDELSREWEELLSDISAAHAQYATEATVVEGGADRKRRHSAALRCRPHAACTHPHAPFLHCAGSDRPLTR